MMTMWNTQEGPTVDGKDTVQSQAGEDNARADTNQSTINKSGLGDTASSTNGSSAIPLSSRSSREDRASDAKVSSAAGTSPPSTITRPPVILSPTDDSNIRLREPLLEDD